MVLRMPRPFLVNGKYYFRQRVPTDLVAMLRRKFVKESLKTSDVSLAKVRNAECVRKYAAYFDHCRKNPGLSMRDVHAISGEVYKEFYERWRESDRNFWSQHHWNWRHLALSFATGQIDRPKDWTKPPDDSDTEVLERDVGKALDAVLTRAGLKVDPLTRKALLKEGGKAILLGMERILQETNGQYAKTDPHADRFPPFVPPKDKAKRSMLAEDVFAAGEKNWSPNTTRKYRLALNDFLAQLPAFGLHKSRCGDWDLARVTKDHVRAWRDSLLDRKKDSATPRTIQREYLGSLKAIYSFAIRDERLSENPADGVLVQEAWRKKGVKQRGLYDDEAIGILAATLLPQGDRASQKTLAARRWAPWLCAYSGARIVEIIQLRGKDVRRRDGILCIHITPEAGGQKSDEERDVPLHDHLIEQGFLEFAELHRPDEPMFHPYAMPDLRDAQDDVVKKQRDHARVSAEAVAGHLSRWARRLGVLAQGDPVDPNHGWRHRFKTMGRDYDADEKILDAIQGHAPPGMGGKYGQYSPKAMAREIAKYPRIPVAVEGWFYSTESPAWLPRRKPDPQRERGQPACRTSHFPISDS